MFNRKKKLYPYMPEREPAIPPGETILDQMEYYHVTREQLADRIGCSLDYLDSVIKGDLPITPELAEKLEVILETRAVMWLRLEASYQSRKKNQEKRQQRWRFLRLLSPTAISGVIAGCLYRGVH